MSNGSLVNTIWVNKSTSLIISTPIFSHLIIDDSYANVTNQLLTNNKLDILHNDLINPTPAGNNIIGKFGIDQTNPGISNKVEVGVVTVNAGLDLNTSNLNLETTQQNVLLGINTVTNNTITLPDSLINIKETLLNIKAKDFATEQTLNTVNNSINTVTDNLTVLNRENTQQLIKNKTDNLDVLLSTRLKSSDTLAKVSTIDNITNTVTIKADTLANQINPLKIDGSGTIQPVSITSLPLPNGSSTSALQTTGNNKLDSIDIKTPALGQALVSNSTPVVLPASQIVALTPIAAITGFNLESTQQLIKAKTDNLDVLLSTRLKATDVLTGVVNVGSVTSITNALPAGNNNIGDVDIVTLPALVAGTAIIGKVGIDQSVPGTSNKVNIGSDGQVSTNGTIFNFSTLNSTTTQLLAGATYTGTIESIINQQAYSLLFFSDQNATITIRQFINVNGTGIISNISFNYIANSTNFSISKVANGNFIQVLVQNTGASATTALQLDTAFGTIPSSTILGNAPSAINEINGNTVSVNSGNSDAGTLRIMQAIESSTGIITTQNLVPNSAATLNSAVEILTNGANAISIQVTGTYTGALSVQLTNDGVRWETITFTSLLNCITGGFTNTIGSATIGIFQFKCSGFLKARITALTAVTGNALLTLRTIREANLIGIDNPLPTGTNNIGSVALISGQNLGSLTTLSNGQTAHSSTITGAPFRIGARVKTANDLTLVNNDATDLVSTTDSALIIKPFAVPELDWTFACPSPVNNTTDVVLRIAASAGLRNYLTSFQITNASATIATEIVIKDGVIIVWRGFVGVGTVLNSAVGVSFATPLRTTAATNLNFACITTGSSVYVNAQGYVAS